MKILYFAWVRQKTGVSEETVEVPSGVTNVGQLIDWLKTRGEEFENAFADLRSIRVAVNQEHTDFDAPIKGAYEVAFFPPVTGG